MSNKNHYLKVFKSDHLGIADLEDYIEENKPLIFTIRKVVQEYNTKVAGRKIDANIAYFTDANIKPLVLNATNSKVVKELAGGSPFVEDWTNVSVELYIDRNVKMKGEVVGGVRIKKKAPKIETFDHEKEQMNNAKTLDELAKIYMSLSPKGKATLLKLKDELKAKLS